MMSKDTVKNNWCKPWLCVCWKRTLIHWSLILKSQHNIIELVTRPDVYQCNVCGQTSKVQSHLFRHILLHLPDYHAYHCSLCSEKFRTEIKGTQHKHKVHGGNGTIKMVTTSEIEQFRKQMVCKKPVAGLVTNSIIFCSLFTIKDWCKKVCFQQTHNQS